MARTKGVVQAKRKPSARWARIEAWAFIGARGTRRMARSPAITARKLAALTRKHQPSPMAATRIPATEGPTTRAALNMEELRPMALCRSFLSTSSTTKDWRTGTSTALIRPSREART